MSTVHMVSSTATQEEVDAALGVTPVESEKAEAAAAAGTEENQVEKAEHKKKGGFVRKIERLETQVELLERQNRELVERMAGRPVESAPSASDDEPQLERFDTYEKYVKALAQWTVRQETKKSSEAEASQQAADYSKEIAREFSVRVEAFKETHPDCDEVLETDQPIYEGVKQAIVEMENGPEVAYYLATHPEETGRLWDMSPTRSIAEVGKISASLTKTDPPVKKPRATPAPAPITPVSGSSASTSTGTPGKRTLAEYRQLRKEGRI